MSGHGRFEYGKDRLARPRKAWEKETTPCVTSRLKRAQSASGSRVNAMSMWTYSRFGAELVAGIPCGHLDLSLRMVGNWREKIAQTLRHLVCGNRKSVQVVGNHEA